MNIEGPLPMVKGTAFLGVLKFVKTSHNGEETLAKVMGLLSDESRQSFKHKIIAVADYPYKTFTELIRAVDKVLGTGDLSLCRELGRYTAKRDVEGIYDFYKKRARPDDLVRDGSVIWNSYYVNAGEMEQEVRADGVVVIGIRRFAAMDEAHARLLEGWMSQAMQEAGAAWITEIRERQSRAGEEDLKVFEGKWRV